MFTVRWGCHGLNAFEELGFAWPQTGAIVVPPKLEDKHSRDSRIARKLLCRRLGHGGQGRIDGRQRAETRRQISGDLPRGKKRAAYLLFTVCATVSRKQMSIPSAPQPKFPRLYVFVKGSTTKRSITVSRLGLHDVSSGRPEQRLVWTDRTVPWPYEFDPREQGA